MWLLIYAGVVVACVVVGQHPAGDGHRPAADVRRLASHHDRSDPAQRPRRGRHRPSAQQPHRVHEPVQPVRVLEHELPRRAPHVPDGAVPRAAGIARRDQGRSAARRRRASLPPSASSCRCCCASASDPQYYIHRKLPDRGAPRSTQRRARSRSMPNWIVAVRRRRRRHART